jgi:predicted cupin superfamily sugar epimerase
MHSAEFWIHQLDLQPHPEGGFFKETYRSSEYISGESLPERFEGPRNFSTSIYFLLRSGDRSLFHRIQSDEQWHFYAGHSLTIYVLGKSELTTIKLGSNPQNGETLQATIPRSCWFGAMVNEPDSYVLSGCTVSPGFDFKDFEMGDRQSLLKEFPEHDKIINALT